MGCFLFASGAGAEDSVAALWGHRDVGWVRPDEALIEGQIYTWMRRYPNSHWRTGSKVMYGRYQSTDRTKRRPGDMIMERESHEHKFNICMRASDPMANIDSMEIQLMMCILLAKGSHGLKIHLHDKKTPGNHASQYNIEWRDVWCRSWHMGLTMHGDLITCMGYPA